MNAGNAHHGNSACCSSPVVSGTPSITFRFWMACPDAPLTRLSITVRPARSPLQ